MSEQKSQLITSLQYTRSNFKTKIGGNHTISDEKTNLYPSYWNRLDGKRNIPLHNSSKRIYIDISGINLNYLAGGGGRGD
jgi:hypothetical protein